MYPNLKHSCGRRDNNKPCASHIYTVTFTCISEEDAELFLWIDSHILMIKLKERFGPTETRHGDICVKSQSQMITSELRSGYSNPSFEYIIYSQQIMHIPEITIPPPPRRPADVGPCNKNRSDFFAVKRLNQPCAGAAQPWRLWNPPLRNHETLQQGQTGMREGGRGGVGKEGRVECDKGTKMEAACTS